MPDQLPQDRRLPRLFWGVLLIGLGATLLIDNFTEVVYFSGRDFVHWWPMILILVGIGKMTGAVGRRNGGFGLIVFGSWFLLNTMTAWDYRETWPLIIMFWGLKMIWDSFGANRQTVQETEQSHVG
jgi:putative Mn2+ efflux pump MntP